MHSIFGEEPLKNREMAKTCEVTGKKAMVGHSVSHSNVKNKRRFYPNLQVKKFYIPEKNKWITLRVSADGIRLINKLGISAALKRAKDKGFYQE